MVSNASERPPRIGLTTYVEEARWGVWDRRAVVLPQSYVESVISAGGLPVLLPPTPGPAAPGAAADGIDALVLTGGADVDPARYGADARPETQGTRADRDRWEIDLLAAALEHGRPVLAICRGAQVLNVALGGTLHQHLPHVVGHSGHQPEPAVLGTTQVRLEPGSLLAEILGTEAKVPCYHHQAIDRLGDGVTAVGWADDGSIEAVVVEAADFAVAVQWHPEDGDDLRLFEALGAAAVGRRPRS